MSVTHPNHSAYLVDDVREAVGLDKRDDFAKAALSGLCANPAHNGKGFAFLAAQAVHCADALIAALNAPKASVVALDPEAEATFADDDQPAGEDDASWGLPRGGAG